MVEEIKILRIEDAATSISSGQICIEAIVDADLAFRMLGVKDHAGNVTKCLAKDKGASVLWLDLLDDTVTAQAGRLHWSADDGGPVMGMIGNVDLRLGQALFAPYATNNSGGAIDAGDAVYISSGSVSSPEVELADKDVLASSFVLGLSAQDIADTGQGYVVTHGLVKELDTSSWTAGDILWLTDTGAYDDTQPTAPAFSTKIGTVIRSHATLGEIYARPQEIPRLSFLSDVHARAQTHTDGDVLAWDSGNVRWDLSTAVLSLEADGEPGGPLGGALKLYAGSGVFLSQAVDGIVINALIDETVYTADTLTLNTGTYVSGDVTDTRVLSDGNFYEVQEVTGVPGFDIDFNFVSVDTTELFDRVRANVLYEGNGSHVVQIRLYNYDTTSWDVKETFTLSVATQFFDFPIEDSTDYVDGSGNAIVSFYHISSGLPSHEIEIDYVALVKGAGGTGGGSATLASTAVGYGDGSNLLTGDATNFTWDAVNRWLKIGSGTPTYLTGRNDCLYIEGRSEFSALVSFASANFYSILSVITGNILNYNNRDILFGTASDAAMRFGTAQTNDALLIGTPLTSETLILCQIADIAVDFGHSAYTNPTLVIHSADATDTDEFIAAYHDASWGRLRSGKLGIAIGLASPSYLTTGGSQLFVSSNSEFAGRATFDGDMLSTDNHYLYFGDDLDCSIVFSTFQTNDTMVLCVPNSARALIICEQADYTVDFGHSAYTDPTLVIHSSDATSTDEFLALSYGNQADFVSGGGGFSFRTDGETANVITGATNCAVIGGSNTVGSTDNFLLVGNSNVIGNTCDWSLHVGQAITGTQGLFSFVLGNDVEVKNNYCSVRGEDLESVWEGTAHFAGDSLGTGNGNACGMSDLCLMGTSTSATTIVLEYAVGDGSPMTVPEGYCVGFNILLHASSMELTGNTGVEVWNVTGIAWNLGGTFHNLVYDSGTAKASAGPMSPSIRIYYNATDDTIDIECTGEASTEIQWVANVRATYSECNFQAPS